MNKIIGVTGPSGAGKGLFCSYLAEFGCTVIDCDKIAHSVTKKGSECLKELVKAFGSEILAKDGRLNRRKLAKIAFSDPKKTGLLNQITHPAILKIIDDKIQKATSTVALDAPLLVEGGLDKICDIVAVIDADEETRRPETRERMLKLMKQLGMTQITWQKTDLLHGVGIAWKPMEPASAAG